MEKMKTGIIRYNLKQRMRQFNGQERHFDVPALVKDINSPKVQERVKLGDLHGYYGHWARTKFGAEPREGGVVDGKVVNLEPCFRTIHLKAYEDGTIEHEAQFYDNEPGRKAYALSQNKSGGFSSVILHNQFLGFDYVLFPNFHKNRPYDTSGLTLDDNSELIDDVVLVLDDLGDNLDPALQADYIEYLLDSVKQLKSDKESLISENELLAQGLAASVAQCDLLTDDVLMLKEQLTQKPKTSILGNFDELQLDEVIRQAERFKTTKLEKLEVVEQSSPLDKAMNDFNRRWS